MRRELFRKIGPELRIPEEHCFFPHPFRIDEISEQIERPGCVETCYVGIGYHGHIAFNEPPISRRQRITVEELRASLTRVVLLGDDSIVVQSIHSAGGNCEADSADGGDARHARYSEIAQDPPLLRRGKRHRSVFRRTIAGEVIVDYPATLAQGHGDAEVCTDWKTTQPITVGLR